MLGTCGDAVATPSCTRCHMDGGGTGTLQRSGRRRQRGPGREHIVDEQYPATNRTRSAYEARPGQPRRTSGARLRGRSDTPQQPRRTDLQRLGGGTRQRFCLIETAGSAMSGRRRRPGDCVNLRRLCRRSVNLHRRSQRCRAQVGERERISQPPGDRALAAVLERVNELAPDPRVGEQQRDRVCTGHRRRLGRLQCFHACSAGTPTQLPAAGAPHLEQHGPTIGAALRAAEAIYPASSGSGPPCRDRRRPDRDSRPATA